MITQISGLNPFEHPANQIRESLPDGRRQYKITEDYCYIWQNAGIWYRFLVKAGKITDGGSLPLGLYNRFGLDPDGLGRTGFLIHDLICEAKGDFSKPGKDFYHEYLCPITREWENCTDPWTDADAARMMHRLHKEASVPWWDRRRMFYAVRCFGPRFSGKPKKT